MRKSRKWLIFAAVLALCISACASLIVGCANNSDTITYTVNVQTEEETPLSGVSVRLRKGNANVGDSVTTGNDGKAVFKAAPDTYTLRVTAPLPYSVPVGVTYTLTEDQPEVTVTLETVFVYTVNLVTEDGDPFYAEGVTVGICTEEGTCLTPVALGTNGVAMINPGLTGPQNYHVQVLGLPETSKIEVEADQTGTIYYYSGEMFTATKNEMTITVYSAIVLTDLEPMSASEKALAFPYNYAAQQRTAYEVTVYDLEPGEIAYFAIKPQILGEYFLSPNGATFLYDGTEMVLGEESGEVGGYLSSEISCTPGFTYFFKAVNNEDFATSATIAVAVPDSTYLTQSGQGANTTLTVGKANTNAIIAFSPTVAGTYSISATGAQVLLSASAQTPDEVIEIAPSDSEYKNNPSISHLVYTSEVGSTIYIAVTVKAASYPAEVGVTITKTGNVTDNKTTVQVTESLSKYTAPADKEFFFVPMNGTATLVKGTDGFYHLGAADGPVVVVNIKGTLDSSRYNNDSPFGGAPALATLDTLTTDYKYALVTKTAVGEDSVDYQMFLRGFTFDQYVVNPGTFGNVLTAPETIATNSYAYYASDEGMYPLTQELKDFLETFYELNKNLLDRATNFAEQAWLFPCGYYDEPIVADVIVGEYKFVKATYQGDDFKVGDPIETDWDEVTGSVYSDITADTYKLVVTKQGNFTIYKWDYTDEVYGEEQAGTWTKSDSGVYTFTIQSYFTLTYTVTFNDGAGTIKLEGDDGDTDNPATVWEFVRGTQD